MTRNQSNYLNMAEAVLALFDANPAAWTGIKVVSNGVTALRDTVSEIRNTAKKQDKNDPVGHTAAKERSRTELEDLVFQMAQRTRSFALVTENDVLAASLSFSRSGLDRMRLNDLLTRSKVVLDACSENLADLVDYRVDESMTSSLEECIDRTKKLNAGRDTVIDKRAEATSRLSQLFERARRRLKALDDLTESYVESNEFVAEYFNARRIHDLRGRGGASEEDTNDE